MNSAEPFLAASVIKFPVLIELFYRMEQGMLNSREKFVLKEEDKLPGCGSLRFLHEGIGLTLEDLYSLMITVSDNTATNLLIKRIGMEAVNWRMEEFGFTGTRLNGKLPFYLDEYEIAHKTGEDEGITHDVGIVFADQPFVVCFCGNGVNVPGFERLMQDVAFDLRKVQTDSVKDT